LKWIFYLGHSKYFAWWWWWWGQLYERRTCTMYVKHVIQYDMQVFCKGW